MMSALGKLIDSRMDGVGVEIRNGNDVIDRKVIRETYRRLKEGLPIDNTFAHSEFWVSLRIGFLFKKTLDLRWCDYPGGDMIDKRNIGRIREWIGQSDGAILLYDLSRHCDEQTGVMDTTVAAIRQKVNMRSDYPIVIALTKRDLVDYRVIDDAKYTADDLTDFVEEKEIIEVTTKGYPNAHVALISILKMVIDDELKLAYNHLVHLRNDSSGSFRDKLAVHKEIKDTESQIDDYTKILETLDRAQRS